MLQRKKSWQQGMKPQRSVHPESIIPGLPYDLALHCLIRVPRMYHTGLRSVCRSWIRVLDSPEFLRAREESALSDAWLLVLFTGLIHTSHFTFCIYDLPTRSLLCRCSLPDSDDRRLIDFRAAAVGARMIVVESRGGASSAPENRTRIFDSLKNRWLPAKSPNVPRSGFAMAVVGGAVFLAGGFDAGGEFEPATEVYDPSTDSWLPRAQMPPGIDRVDGEVVFGGKMFVRGFQSETSRCVMLVYDPAMDLWQEDESSGMNSNTRGELLATAEGVFCLNPDDRLFRLDQSGCRWTPVQVSISSCAGATSSFNAHAQRAFGLRNEIFVLGADSSSSCETGEVACHGLFVGSSWNRAGSVVIA